MPKAALLLAILLTLALAIPLTGCIEAKDPPEHGEFLIEAHSDVVFFITEEGGTLHGAHAEVETDLHHEHPEYNWTIGDHHFEGSDVEIGENDFGIELASYDLDYYGEGRHIPVYVVSLEDVDETWAFVADGTPLAHHEDGANLPSVTIVPVSGLEVTDKGTPVPEFNYELMEGRNITEEGLVINVSLPWDAENATTYVAAFHWVAGLAMIRWHDSVTIYPGELHQLRYTGPSSMEIAIVNVTNTTHVHFEGAFEDLPHGYEAHLGVLEWEGEVGGEEEAPGLTAWSGLLAMALAVLLASLRRRR